MMEQDSPLEAVFDAATDGGAGTRLDVFWAVRLAEFGIGVYEIRPGVIHTDMTRGVSSRYDALIEDGLTLQPRWGEPEDVARAVRMLVQEDLAYSTGQVLRVDGGMCVRRL